MNTIRLLVLLALAMLMGLMSHVTSNLAAEIQLQSALLVVIEDRLMEFEGIEDRLFHNEGGLNHLHLKVDHIHDIEIDAIVKALEPILLPETKVHPQSQEKEPNYGFDRQPGTFEIQVL